MVALESGRDVNLDSDLEKELSPVSLSLANSDGTVVFVPMINLSWVIFLKEMWLVCKVSY